MDIKLFSREEIIRSARLYEAHGRDGKLIPVLMNKQRYGFRLNVYHPKLIEGYAKWREENGHPMHFPVADAVREEYEAGMIPKILEQIEEEKE